MWNAVGFLNVFNVTGLDSGTCFLLKKKDKTNTYCNPLDFSLQLLFVMPTKKNIASSCWSAKKFSYGYLEQYFSFNNSYLTSFFFLTICLHGVYFESAQLDVWGGKITILSTSWALIHSMDSNDKLCLQLLLHTEFKNCILSKSLTTHAIFFHFCVVLEKL